MTGARAAQILASREMGKIEVSIGTSLALEGAMGILEDHPNSNPPLDSVDVLYVNIRTLVRNLVGSIPKDDSGYITPEDLAWTLVNEISVIEGAIGLFTTNRVQVQVYLCNYRSLDRRFPKAILKNANTDRQRTAVLREELAIDAFKTMIEDSDLKIIDVDVDLPKDSRRVLMLTSYVIDLLQKYQFRSLVLLESHTGAAKVQAFWHTKLTGGKDLPMIPFNRMTLQFFGDGSNLFTGYPIKFRRVMIDIATKNNWNSLTSKDYILSCIRKAHEPELEYLAKQMFVKSN